MPDIIQLLPDAVANQIAAGEVVQRPSSAVKELMENAVDAGSTRIEVYIADAGKKLIRVKDNGCGMSATDTRKSLERHATSKIRAADDLFDIKTMGFRGEAIASIVAVSKADIKSRLHEEDLGTHLEVEASKVISQEPHPCDSGTDIQIKNLFYNIPARRKFLKSNAVELKHIIDQFQRIALAYPDISFRLVNENTELFELPRATLRKRIVAVFGNKYNERLVPLEESTAFIKVKGFLCKPEFAKKKRGEQYFFINQRFIKSNYLHHAVSKAFQDLISRDVHPSYFIYLEADPSFIDINIHPTKTEAKFEDERSVYAVLHSTARKALGEHNIAPSLDFERETSFDDLPKGAIKSPEVKINPDYNPFDASHAENSKPRATNFGGNKEPRTSKSDWEQMYSILNQEDLTDEKAEPQNKDIFEGHNELESSSASKVLAVWGKYIVTQTKEELMVIHIGRAYQRILYESSIAAMANQSFSSQQLLFPEQIDLNQSDTALMGQLTQEFTELGFDIEPFGEHDFIVRGVPSDLSDASPQELIEGILENFSYNKKEKAIERRKKLAKSMAVEGAKVLTRKFNQAMAAPLVDRLFACEQPFSAPSGNTSVLLLSADELASHFK